MPARQASETGPRIVPISLQDRRKIKRSHRKMFDVLFMATILSLFFFVGYPASHYLLRGMPRRYLAAPILGNSIVSVLVILTYKYGGSPRTAISIIGILSIPGLYLFLLSWKARKWDASDLMFMMGLVVCIFIVLLPKWLSTPAFSVFQGNHWDQINYLSIASATRHFSFAQLTNLNQSDALGYGYASFATAQLNARPTVAIVYGVFTNLFNMPTAKASYAYMGALQVLIFFATLFVLVNVLRFDGPKAVLVATAATIGFFLQYIFDINAWSELSSVSCAILGLTIVVLGLTGHMRIPKLGPLSDSAGQIKFCLALSICLAGLLYIYPEITTVYGPAAAAAFLCAFIRRSDRFAVCARGLAAAAALLLAVVICIPFWSGTIQYLLNNVVGGTVSEIGERQIGGFTSRDTYLGGTKFTSACCVRVDLPLLLTALTQFSLCPSI